MAPMGRLEVLKARQSHLAKQAAGAAAEEVVTPWSVLKLMMELHRLLAAGRARRDRWIPVRQTDPTCTNLLGRVRIHEHERFAVGRPVGMMVAAALAKDHF